MTTAVMKRQHLFRTLVLFLCCCGLFFWPVCTISSETGLSVLTTDADNYDHSIVIEVKDPHSLKSSCPTGVSPCLADGSLRVALDGEEALLAPGTVLLGKDVQISAVNLPGACRSFGFEKVKFVEEGKHK